METKLDNFVIFRRQIASDVRDGLITRAEFNALAWCRLNANPYGVFIANLEVLNDELFNGERTKNYINKLLLNLKKKGYLYFKNRAGRRGSFEIHFGDWPLPNNGGVKTLDRFFSKKSDQNQDPTESVPDTEPSQSLGGSSQSIDEIKNQIKQNLYGYSSDDEFRGTDTDTDIYKDKDIF